MLKFISISLLQVFIIALPTLGQNNTWVETNTGIGSLGEFDVVSILITDNANVYAAIRQHSAGEEKDGIYKYNPATESWTKIADRLNQYGYSALVSSGNRIFAIPGGNSQTLYELNLATGEWEKILEVPDYGLSLSRGLDAVDNKLYLPCRIESDKDIERFPARKFRKNEEFVIEVNADNGEFTLLRNVDNPLIIGPKGGNPQNPIALKNGKVYHYSTFDYRDTDGTGGLYEWDGEIWNPASYGLNAINITGSGFGPIGPIYADANHEKLFVRTEQGFYEKADDGWFKYFYRTSAKFFISPDFMFVSQSDGSILKVDRAVRQELPNEALSCIQSIQNFITPDNGQSFFAEIRTRRDANGNCSDNQDIEQKTGIYRYVPNGNPAGTVKNLHIENGTYVGGRGSNFAAESGITPAGKLLLAGTFHDNMGVAPTALLNANSESTGKVYVMDQWGTAVEQTLVLGDAIYDMDIDEITGEVALLGNFGVAVLHSDFTLKWSDLATVPDGEDGSYRPRISLAADGKVVAVVQDSDKTVVRLYAANGSVLHDNTELYDQDKKIYDLEISSDANHQQYYVCGFTQAHSNLQVAYLQAYDFSSAAHRNWRTWGFSVGGSEGLSLSDNGADTRAYRIKARNGGDVYVAGESAGGGPGGFSIFAYNGKDLKTKVADQNNDFFTDGTNSSGPSHITFLSRINP
ncbi:MAG: hypothetical protein WBA23_26030, partial [Tunicatimonas sp.]|uniref:hypothetical protein n=1 Tax=Tunicatimonas sp. TaxID=1940096 RepID=UPI003C790361